MFSAKVSDLGISSNHTVIVYAKEGSFSAPRCWWTFRTFGHERVHVLDGGFQAWKASEGRFVLILVCCVFCRGAKVSKRGWPLGGEFR